MSDFKTFHKKWRSAFRDDQQIQVQAIKSVSDEAVNLNKEQLLSSTKADGESFKDYSGETLAIKQEKSRFISSTGRLALKDTGDFHSEMFARPQSFTDNTVGLFISSRDSKTGMLTATYGEDIFGLVVANKETISDKATRKYILTYKKRIA